jgi:ribonuclease BN (tRNA processing enzyme)
MRGDSTRRIHPDREPMTSALLEWRVLGAGSILPRAAYGCSGYALRLAGRSGVTLFDCGPGTIRALGSAGIALEDVERVVLSHFHPDHVLDLFALAFARRNPSVASRPHLDVVGPRGTSELLERGADIYGEKRWLRFESTSVREIDPGASGGRVECGSFELRWTANGHTPEAVSWRVDLADGRALMYTGDTGENPAVAALARNADLFVCECSFPDDEAVAHHLSPSSAARLARDAGCRRLVLTHFYPRMDPEAARAASSRIYGGPIELARDGSLHVVEPSAGARPAFRRA